MNHAVWNRNWARKNREKTRMWAFRYSRWYRAMMRLHRDNQPIVPVELFWQNPAAEEVSNERV